MLYFWIRPKHTVHGRALKKWYRHIEGHLPANWNTRPGVLVTHQSLCKFLDDIVDYGRLQRRLKRG